MQEQTKILPTVGRIVNYFSYGTPNGEYKPEARAAIITAVKDAEAGIIDICVFNPAVLFFNQDVKQAVEAEEKGGRWDWLPFQKDQQMRAGWVDPKEQSNEAAPDVDDPLKGTQG